MVLEELENDKQEDDIDWLSVPVKKQAVEKQVDNSDLDDRPIKPKKVNNLVNIDDMPVGGQKKTK